MIDTAFDDGVKVGLDAGLKEGELRKALDTAKNMLLLGLDIQTIAKCTGLRVEQIAALK